MVGWRWPTPHLTALASSSLQLCVSLGVPTGNPRAREPSRGREWIRGERGTVEKLPTWGKEEMKEQGDSEKIAAETAGYFLGKEGWGKNSSVKQGVF